jgi:hypothetical protein
MGAKKTQQHVPFAVEESTLKAIRKGEVYT